MVKVRCIAMLIVRLFARLVARLIGYDFDRILLGILLRFLHGHFACLF